MRILTRSLPALAFALSIACASCGGSSSSEDPAGQAGAPGGDAGAEDAAVKSDAGQSEAGQDVTTEQPATVEYCDNPEPGFDEAKPGINFTFDIGTSVMMGQTMGLAVGTFFVTAREDYCNKPDTGEVPLDTCTDLAEATVLPQCASKQECAAEQDCLPDTNQNGQPIPGTEKCRTAGLKPLDMGPFTVTGFADGPHTFKYNAQQKGAYTIDGAGDGQVDAAKQLAYDTEYAIEGAGNADAGLGAFTGSFHMPADFVLNAPALVDLTAMPGLKAIEVDPTQDLTLEWTGGDPSAVLILSLNGGPKMGGKPVRCRVKNDGSFTLEARWIDTIKLGPNGFVNMMEMRLESPVDANASGPGLTRSRVSVIQTRILNLQKKQ